MSHSTLPECEPNSTSTLPEQPGVLVVRKHHFLVRWSHWLNVPILLGLILSGISIYWASDLNATSPLPEQPGVLVVRKHHFLVRWSHWLNVPILLGLILSGISIYWASPIYQH